jgi:phosphopantothenoylcysteine decarboxylase
VVQLLSQGFAVKIVATVAAMKFLSSAAAEAEKATAMANLSCSNIAAEAEAALQTVVTDDDEWKAWTNRGDPVLHIVLRQWADVAVVAPLDANTLAKLAGGICDNLLTCVLRAWEIGVKPVVLAPAMNTYMYEHPLTGPQLQAVQELYGGSVMCRVVGPVSKRLECGDVGSGAMSGIPDIVDAVTQVMAEHLGSRRSHPIIAARNVCNGTAVVTAVCCFTALVVFCLCSSLHPCFF